MDRKKCASLLRITTILMIIGGVLYMTLYRRVSYYEHPMTPRHMEDTLLFDRIQSHGHCCGFEELKQNISLLADKVRALELLNSLKQRNNDSAEMTENTEISRNTSNLMTSQPTSLLTLFTTLKWNKNDEVIINNTLTNWASFKPVVNPVIFTNDLFLASLARNFGWEILNSSKSASNGLPVLKFMYLSAMTSHKSIFYCYANADLLFDGSLIKTLINIHYHTLALPFNNIFITGIRYNVVNVNKSEVSKRENIKQLVNTRGSQFIVSAEDYFITDRFYPWDSIPEVVVASVAYDNWLVMNAREKRHFVIDASKTITVVHQSVDDNNHRSHWRDTAQYNGKLLTNLTNINIPYHKGFLTCIEHFTTITDDKMIIGERKVDAVCN